MTIDLFMPFLGASRKNKRLGRGYGSGKGGHTVGRGAKGLKARNNVNPGFEGGQVPLYKRLPEIGGFTNHNAKRLFSVDIAVLNRFEDGEVATPLELVKKHIIKEIPKYGIKILATGELKRKITVKGFSLSDSAKEKIDKSGSTIEY